MPTKEEDDTASQYTRQNQLQIYKVRECLRKTAYLMDSKTQNDHMSLNGEVKLSEDLVHFSELAINSTKAYVNARLSNTPVRIKPVYVTQSEYDEANALENVSQSELKVKIFQMLELLKYDTAKVQEEYFNRSVRYKNKKAYIDFFYKLCELSDDSTDDDQL